MPDLNLQDLRSSQKGTENKGGEAKLAPLIFGLFLCFA